MKYALRVSPSSNGQRRRVRRGALFTLGDGAPSIGMMATRRVAIGTRYQSRRSSVVEHLIGNEEVMGSIPIDGSMFYPRRGRTTCPKALAFGQGRVMRKPLASREIARNWVLGS